MTTQTGEPPKAHTMVETSEKSSVEEKAGTTARLSEPPDVDEQLNSKTDTTGGTSAEETKEKSNAAESQTATATPEYPKAWKLFVIVAALCLAVFLVALDQTIVAVAVPKITDHFHSLDDVGWYVFLNSIGVFTRQDVIPGAGYSPFEQGR